MNGKPIDKKGLCAGIVLLLCTSLVTIVPSQMIIEPDISSVDYDNPAIVWRKTFGGKNVDNLWSFRKTNDEGFILIGETSSFSVGGSDGWLIRLDTHGEELWNKTYGDKTGDAFFDGRQTLDGGFILAGSIKTYEQDYKAWLVKTDGYGTEMWNKTYGGVGRDQAYSVIESSDGGFVFCGGTGSFSKGPNDYWVLKTDENGNELWNITYGTKGYDWGYNILEVEDGYVFTGGTDVPFPGKHYLNIGLIKLDKNGNILWARSYNKPPSWGVWDEGYGLTQTSDGGYIITGIAHTISWGEDGGGAGWVMKTDLNGRKIWEKSFGGEKNDCFTSVKTLSDGGFIVSGWTFSYGSGSSDLWLLKFNEKGNQEWEMTLGGEKYEWSMLHSIEASSDGCYLIAGTTYSYGAGSSDMIVYKVKEPELIIDFSGGLGLSITIRNNYDCDFNDVSWDLTINRLLYTDHQQGTIELLPAGAEVQLISNKVIFGLGPMRVRVGVNDFAKTVHCKIIGMFIFGVR